MGESRSPIAYDYGRKQLPPAAHTYPPPWKKLGLLAALSFYM